MTVTFAADGSSYQGQIDWVATKAAGFGAGTEKASEGTDYANPFWPAARAALGAVASPSFTPGAYHYLTAGNGAGQADWFARQAGPIPGFVIWCDLERATAGTQPTVADARDFVTRLRAHYPGKRIGLYASESFTGAAKLTFADMLWSPHYVEGTGTPPGLYREVPASWWDAYGGLTPALLQFSQSAPVPGVAGVADISAYRGTAAQLHDALLGIRPTPKPAPAPVQIPAPEDTMLLNRGKNAVTPIVLAPGDKTLYLLGSTPGAEVIVHFGGQSPETAKELYFKDGAEAFPVPAGCTAAEVTRVDAGSNDVGWRVT